MRFVDSKDVYVALSKVIKLPHSSDVKACTIYLAAGENPRVVLETFISESDLLTSTVVEKTFRLVEEERKK